MPKIPRRWKPTIHVFYKICYDFRLGVFWGHKTTGKLTRATREARKLVRAGFTDVWVGQITKQRTRVVTNKVLGRKGSNPCIS